MVVVVVDDVVEVEVVLDVVVDIATVVDGAAVVGSASVGTGASALVVVQAATAATNNSPVAAMATRRYSRLLEVMGNIVARRSSLEGSPPTATQFGHQRVVGDVA